MMYLAIQKRYARETHGDTQERSTAIRKVIRTAIRTVIRKPIRERDAQRYARETQTDTHSDTQTDTHADTILKLNQTKLNSRKENHQRKEEDYVHPFLVE